MADAPAQGGGGLGASLKSKFGPLPVWAWLGIITVLLLGYWLYEQHKAGATGTTPSTGGSSAAPGVVVINQDQAGEDTGEDTDGKKKKKPKPKPKHKPPKEPDTRQVRVGKDETLGQLATQRHWSANTLRQVEEENVQAGEGELTKSSKLTRGEEILRPLRH
jgi:hypothetical protein